MKPILFLLLLFPFYPSLGQVKNIQNSSTYKSSADADLTIKNLTLAPLTDNVSGIYAKPLNDDLIKAIAEESVWSYQEFKSHDSSNMDFGNPDNVKKVLAANSCDSLIVGRISKSPAGINIKLSLYVGGTGFPLAEEALTNYNGFEIKDVRDQLLALYQKLKGHIPYSGIILGRKDNLVTINIGQNENLHEGDIVDVVQILSITRHPKFYFLINTEKEILGRIKIQKVEKRLSFAAVEYERSNNLIATNMKLDTIDFVDHPVGGVTKDNKIVDQLAQKDGSEISLGKNPHEYLTEKSPTFGQVDLMVGLGSYTVNNSLTDGSGIGGKGPIVPSIKLAADLWITTNFYAEFQLKEFIFSLSNSYSSPSSLNVNSTDLDLDLGYSFLLNDDFFGPKLQVYGGLKRYKFNIDDSNPTAFTSMDYSAFMLGVGGSFPLTDSLPITLGAKLEYALSASESETPVSSSDGGSAKVTDFSLWTDYKYRPKIKFKATLDYDLFSTSFSGSGGTRAVPATTASHGITTLYVGVSYLF